MTIFSAVLFACFVWWFSTGAILWVVKTADRGTQSAHRNATLAAIPVLVLGLTGLYLTADDGSPMGVYLAFLSTIAVWGWFELAFLCGVVTGPMPKPCPPNVDSFERFLRGWGAVAYQEIALLFIAIGLLVVTEGTANQIGMLTFMILFFARMSAKLNIYMGVQNINTEFLPRPVRHLASHFRSARINWLFPISVSGLGFTTGFWIERVTAAQDPGMIIGYSLLAALTALAMIEHWLMVVPLADAKLWQWMLPQTKAGLPQTTKVGENHGL
ncbi:MAG: putative photosynthetic complex assembly protein PuhE [Pseudomonadota bacterium]